MTSQRMTPAFTIPAPGHLALRPKVPPPPPRRAAPRGPYMATSASRRAFLALSACGLASTLWGARARAALTATEARAEALRAREALEALETLVQLGEFDAFRDKLRSGPMGRVRAACSSLYRALPEAAGRAEAEGKYRVLVRRVEAVDHEALLESRKGGDGTAVPKFGELVVAFDEFLTTVSVGKE